MDATDKVVEKKDLINLLAPTLLWVVGICAVAFIFHRIFIWPNVGIEAKKTEMVSLLVPVKVGNRTISECRLMKGAILSAPYLKNKGVAREVYSVPLENPTHIQGGCEAGDMVLNRTIGNGR